MKNIFFGVILPIIAFAGWSVQQSGTSVNLKDVDFVDANHGWAVGGEDNTKSGIVLCTSDGGTNWFNETPVLAEGIDVLHGVSFVDTLTGWAVGDDTLRCSLILKTTDGGLSWIRQATPIDTPEIVSVSFVDQNNGWISHGGPHGPSFQQIILHTTNGGNNWQVYGWDGYDGGTARIFFKDLLHGWVAGGTEMNPSTRGYVMTTSNGGTGWYEGYHWGADIPYTYPLMTSVHFPVDAINGWACGKLYGAIGPDYEVRIVRTSDGGFNWDEIQVIGDSSVGTPYGIRMVDLLNGWMVGRGGDILRTTDGFNTWHFDTSGVIATLRALDFVDLNNGWTVGDQGTILKYRGTNSTAEQTDLRKILLDSKFTVLPAKNGRLLFFFASAVDQSVVFTIYNALGQSVFSQKIFMNQGNLKYDLRLPSGLPAGVYLLNARTNMGIVTAKFVMLK